MRKIRRFTIVFVLITLLFFESSLLFLPTLAKADDLIIEDNGSIVLLITDNSSVLAAESATTGKAAPASPQPTKVVVPPRTDSSVKIDPKPSTDNKVKITVETPAAKTVQSTTLVKQTGSPSQTPSTSKAAPTTAIPPSTTTPISTNTPAAVISPQTVVDKVVLNGSDQKPVITISGNNSKDLTVQSGSVSISTSLPLQVNNNVSPDGSVKHDLSVTTQGGPVKISVLPDVAVRAAEAQAADTSLPVSNKNISLSTSSSTSLQSADPTYVVKEERKGKLLGIVNVTLSSQVNISATSGKTTYHWQSPLSLLGFLVK